MTHEQAKEEMKKTLSPKRFLHVLAVAEEVGDMCAIFGFADRYRLITSALLHDCTKPFSYEEHLSYARLNGLSLSEDDICSPEVLHARTGALRAEHEFGTDGKEIFCHTTGKEDMTLSEKILFLADYIEKTRQHEICLKTRAEFYSSLKNNPENKLRILDETVLKVLENTVRYLQEKQFFIHSDTLRAIDFLKEDLNETK